LGGERGLAALALLAFAACSAEAPKTIERETVQAPTAIVQSTSVPTTRAIAGTVRSANVSPLAAKIVGNVVRVHVSEGDRVTRGQLLVEIDAREGEAQASAASSAITAAEANANLAETTYQRYAALRERKSVSQQELDDVKARRDASRAELARIRSMSTQARTFLDFSSVRSPIDGIVTARLVDPGAQAAPGMTLVIVEDARASRVEAIVPEELSVRAGDRVTLRWSGGLQPAKVTRVQPTLDPTTRGALVQIDLDGVLRSGTYVRVLFTTGARGALVVPDTAIVRHSALTSVFVVDDGVARMRLITVGESNEVLSGLSAGERIVTQPKNVRDGVKVG